MQEEDFVTILDLENQVAFLILEHFVTISENKPYYNLMKTALMDQFISDKSKTKDGKTCDASLVNSAPTPSPDASSSNLEKFQPTKLSA